ncbi:MAG: hypothetical protein LBN74_10475 [Prevotella sp.]|jgi:hypothetical protein|nr:hypothetical protein [Prevotella sp.]
MKDKKMIILVAVIIVLLIGLSYASSKAPKAVDWEPTFINTKTSPYGTYITYELLGDLFDKKNIRSTRRPIYNNLKKSDVTNTIQKEVVTEANTIKNDPTAWYRDIEASIDTTSYIFINTTFLLDKVDLQYLLNFVGLGNNVFISSEEFSSSLMDTLKIQTKKVFFGFEADTIYSLVDFPDKKYRFKSIQSQTRLNTDSCLLPVRPLAFNNKKDTVFVDVQYGKGHFYIHTIPSAFANVNLLQIDKYDFAFKSLSYLPKNSKIIWDEYQKQGGIGDNDSIFRAMLNNKPLRIALYLILAGFLLFMIFRAKRAQRVIPVINPPVNSSLEFLSTVSNLYYRKKDFKTIAEKRQSYFLDFIRKNYYMSTENINDEFLNVLSAKSGMDKGHLTELFSLYKDMVILPYAPNDIFLKYNNLLEEFYRIVKNK